MNLTEKYDALLREVDYLEKEWEIEENLRQTDLEKHATYTTLSDVSLKDIGTVKTVYTKLEKFYIEHKKSLTQELCNELSNIINTLFNNNYDFNFKIDLKRNKKHTTLIDERKNGNVRVVCGGAVKQTISFLSSLSILRQKGSNICWLDEAFANFGSEEIQKIPEILKMIDNMQIIFTEHKSELQPEEGTNIIQFSRENKNSAQVSYQTPELIEEVKNEIENKVITEQDLEILEMFNIERREI